MRGPPEPGHCENSGTEEHSSEKNVSTHVQASPLAAHTMRIPEMDTHLDNEGELLQPPVTLPVVVEQLAEGSSLCSSGSSACTLLERGLENTCIGRVSDTSSTGQEGSRSDMQDRPDSMLTPLGIQEEAGAIDSVASGTRDAHPHVSCGSITEARELADALENLKCGQDIHRQEMTTAGVILLRYEKVRAPLIIWEGRAKTSSDYDPCSACLCAVVCFLLSCSY